MASIPASSPPRSGAPFQRMPFKQSARSGLSSALVTGLSGLFLVSSPILAEEKQALPDPIPVEGFQQLLPRGAIPAVVDPTFVPASEADIPADAWVLGFDSGDGAYAYDLNLLNHHEVVNHGDEEGRFAAVW